MKNTSTLLYFISLFLFFSCNNKGRSIYESCCEVPATSDFFFITVPYHNDQGIVVDTTLEAKVYIPNIIVNEDPNDALVVFANYAVDKIISFHVSDHQGNVLFSRENFWPNVISHGWIPEKSDGTYHQGVFNYEATIDFIDGQRKTYYGRVCVFPCEDVGFPIKNGSKCAFPSQHDGDGGLNLNLPGSDHCF